jgi:hypothetical protein
LIRLTNARLLRLFQPAAVKMSPKVFFSDLRVALCIDLALIGIVDRQITPTADR